MIFARTAFYAQAASASKMGESTLESADFVHYIRTFVVDDLYERLGISRDASVQQIKIAYRQRALQCHPDLATSDVSADYEKAFRAVTEAYQCLCNSTERRRYDRKWHVEKSVQESSRVARESVRSQRQEHTVSSAAEEDTNAKHDVWNRYNKYQYFRVSYTKRKHYESHPLRDETKSMGSVHIRMSRGRSETIFKRAFMGRKVEHIILDMHQAIRRNTEDTTATMYDIDSRDMREKIKDAINRFRCQEKAKKSELQTKLRRCQPCGAQGKKLSFIPPYNITIPKGTSVLEVPPTKFINPHEIFNFQSGDSVSSSSGERDHLSSLSTDAQATRSKMLRGRYRITDGDILPKYADTRDYARYFSLTRLRSNWNFGQGMLYSYHRPL